MIVADTNIVAHLFNQTTLTKTAQAVLKKDSSWILPTLWREEYANVLSKLARIEQRSIHEVIEFFKITVEEVRHCEVIVDVEKALGISIEYKISVYDAHFASLAIDYHIPLVTEDKEVLKKCSQFAVNMQAFLKNQD